MKDKQKKESDEVNFYFDFLFKGLMNQKEEYTELLEKAKLTYYSVKATEQEIRTQPPKFPTWKVGEKREFFVWEALENEQEGYSETTLENRENKSNNNIYELLKKKFKSEIYNDNQNLIQNLNFSYFNKNLTSKPTNLRQKYLKDSEYYKIYIEDIVNKIDIRKTCMIKNIPNKYTVEMLINLLNEDHFGEYDFLYLRMDFVNECNVGYAFVNFTRCHSVISFYKKIHGKKWKNFSSNKIAELTYATMQGIEQIKNKFKYSTILAEKENYRPKLFYTKGELKGREKPFF